MVIPFFLLCDFFVKNVTVTGTIGNTQGVTNAIKPPKKPSKKIAARLLFCVLSSPQLFTGFLMSIAADFMLMPELMPPSKAAVKSKGRSGKNASPLLKNTESLPGSFAGTTCLICNTAFHKAFPSDT